LLNCKKDISNRNESWS